MNLIAKEFPNARLLSFGLIVGWGSIMFGKELLSASVAEVLSPSELFFLSTLSLALGYLIFFPSMKFMKNISSALSIRVAAVALSASSAFLVFAGGLGDILYGLSAFCAVVTGLSCAALYFWAAVEYSTVPPRKALLYAVFSLLLSVAMYFIIFGSTAVIGKIILCATPLLVVVLMPSPKLPEPRPSDSYRSLLTSSAVWRFALSVLLIALVINIGVGYLQTSLKLELLYVSVSTGQVLSLLVGAILFGYALCSQRDFDYCQIFYPIIFASVVLIALSYILGADFPFAISLSTAIRNGCTITIWCMLVYFVYYRSSLQAFSVFCLAQVGVTLGGLFGNVLGQWLAAGSFADKTEASIAYVALIVLLVGVLTLLFPERTLKRLIVVDPSHLAELSGGNQQDNREQEWTAKCESFAKIAGLTQRELEVFMLIAKSKSNEVIAEELTISSYTVKTHRQNIYTKAGVHSLPELLSQIESSH